VTGSERRTIRLNFESYPDRPARDTAVTRALLDRVASGDEPETLRLHRPAAAVAFGPHDRIAPGYHRAIAAARAGGFDAIERLAGGRAAVFHEHTIAFAWTIPDAEAAARIQARFEEISTIVRDALRRLGIDARVGEVRGEYCPGRWSVNARGATKLMGVGQRLVRGAAHVGGVIVVDGSQPIRDVLVPVYEALDLDWEPATVGSVADELAMPPGARPLSDPALGAGSTLHDAVMAAIVTEISERHDLFERPLGPEILEPAELLEPAHLCPPESSNDG
jgi:lipoate-protein ligase A